MTHSADHNEPAPVAHKLVHLVDESATLGFGARLAGCVTPGARIYLRGPLGSGKTTLVRGVLGALGFAGRVRSPSYTLVELYVLSSLDLYHFDFYRFRDPQEWDDAGFREYFHGAAACLVEWPEKAGAALPRPDLDLCLSVAGSGRDARIDAYSGRGEQCLTALPAI